MIELTKVRLRAKGTKPLLLNNARLADPLDDYARALAKISGKRKKTDEDRQEMSRIEFLGGLYWDEEIGVYLPGAMIQKNLIEGARLTKLGKQVERGVFIEEDMIPLVHPARKLDPESLFCEAGYVDRRTAVVSGKRVVRTRPVFRNWGFETDVIVDTSMLDVEALGQIATAAGAYIGLGNWRPRFGRYESEIELL